MQEEPRNEIASPKSPSGKNVKILIACEEIGELEQQIKTTLQATLGDEVSLCIVRSGYQILSALGEKYDGIISETDLTWSIPDDAVRGSFNTATLRELFAQHNINDGIDTIFNQLPLAWLQRVINIGVIWLDFFSINAHAKRGLIINKNNRVPCKEKIGSRKTMRQISDKDLPILENLIRMRFQALSKE